MMIAVADIALVVISVGNIERRVRGVLVVRP